MRLVGRIGTFSSLPTALCAMMYYILTTVNDTNNMSLFTAYHVLTSYKPVLVYFQPKYANRSDTGSQLRM